MELYQRIAEETRNQARLEKKLIDQKKTRNTIVKKGKKKSKEALKKEEEAEAKRRMDIEIRHQTEEAETRALGRKMMFDATKNKPSFNASCCKLLNNFQGNITLSFKQVITLAVIRTIFINFN